MSMNNEYMNKLNEIKIKFDSVQKQVNEFKDELKRLQGEYRVVIEMGLRMNAIFQGEDGEFYPVVNEPSPVDKEVKTTE